MQLIHLIREGVLTWISEVNYYSKHVEYEEEKYNERMKIMFQVYLDLMKAFELFKGIHQFLNFFFIADLFLFSLSFVQETIEIYKYHIPDDQQFHIMVWLAAVCFWITRRTVFIVLLCTLCEKYYMTISDADAYCSCLLNRFQETVAMKRLCKNVLRLNRAAFHKIRAYHVFTIDGQGVTTWVCDFKRYGDICLRVCEEESLRQMKLLFQVYVDLLEAFNIFKRTQHFIISILIVDVFTFILLYVEKIIEIAGMPEDNLSHLLQINIVTIIWMLKKTMFIVVLSAQCEKLYMAIYEADATCSYLLGKIQHRQEIKKLCKNLQRLHRAGFYMMRACYIFQLRGKLAQEFISLVFGYVVVLLQFAIL
ncbi:hypothetical protein HW555_010364 [Spodoptera exigua]|uniref:Gustatory receptor n=1 Tax=Spodoptera exigua TaxID=7107 RepID=A0A835G795_SPOEX|nr:hypothetical protein HW555_010364 [Spodoptera exigua]